MYKKYKERIKKVRNATLFKYFLIMKVVFFLLLVSILHVNASVSAQKIYINKKNTSLAEVLKEVRKQSGYNILSTGGAVKNQQVIGINLSNANIEEAMNKILQGFNLAYKIVEKNVVVSKEINDSKTLIQPKVVTVTGKVTDDKGEPLVGVNVTMKESQIGTVTDANGNYKITAPDSKGALVFSYIGFSKQEISVQDRKEISVVLKPESSKLEEIVVIGYGTQSKRNVTGSISKVSMKDHENSPNTNVTQALRGNVAGVQFTESGRPGQNGNILIRGPRSLSASNSPLILLDGIFFNGTLATINPNDIESIEILKDASATAIYGSRAANGVILITSKRGETDKPKFNFNSYLGVSDWSYKPTLLTPERYIQKTLDARRENGMEANPANIEQYLTSSEAENYRKGLVSNPWDEISQSGRIQSYDVNISGKTNRNNYFLSASYFNETGVILGDQQKRISLRSNIENQVTDAITIGTNAIYTDRDLSGVPASVESATTASPYGNWYYDDGLPTLNYVDEDTYRENAVRRSILRNNQSIYNNLFANFYTNIKLPLKGLVYRFNYSPNYRWERNYMFERQDIHILNVNNREASKSNRHGFDWVAENILKYETNIDKNNVLDVTLLYGANKSSWENTVARSVRLPNDELGWNNLALGELLTNNSDASTTRGISSMVRLNYRFKNKYLLTMTARRDGSSVFGANNKYATFPSAAFAWIASDEKWLRDISFVDMLKFRVSYGAVGNQAIEPFQSLSMIGSTRYVFGDGSPYSVGSIPLAMANSDLKWETTYATNIAMDFELVKSRINGTVEWYDLNTKDLLIARSLPHATGFISTMANLGKTNNQGVEFSLNTVNVTNNHFGWNSNFVFSYNRNRIVSLYGVDNNGDGREDDDIGNRWFIGHPIDVAYDYVFDGIYQDSGNGYRAGDVRLKDLNEDGKLDAENDRTVLGQTGQPKYRWGITNNFRYKKLSLSIFINAMQGWVKPVSYFRSSLRSQNMFDYGWWTEENKSNKSPSLIYDNPLGHQYYYSRDFVRIQDVSLRYDFKGNKMLSKIGIENLGVWLSGKNLLTFTDWPGMDPENGNSYDSFPMMRTFSAGFNMIF